MEKIFHYTSNKNWDLIKSSGFLLPKTNPRRKRIELSDRVNKIIKHELYLVGIQEPLDKGWIEYGLMKHLFVKTSAEVILSVPILEKEGAFVREHTHASPKKNIELFNKDLFEEVNSRFFGFSELSNEDKENFIASWKKYYESTIPLENYEEGQYEVPEIWLPQKTPVEQLEAFF